MKNILFLTAFCVAGSTALALPDYEPFADATGSGGTSYSTGSNLSGQSNAGGTGWFTAGTGTGNPQPTLGNTDLTISGLASSGGGHSAIFGGNGTSARLNLSVDGNGVTAGSVYFSLALRLTDISTLTSGGTYFIGLNNSQGTTANVPGTVVDRIMTRSTTGGYNIGIQMGSQGTLGNAAYDPGVFTTSDTLFLVGSYTFNPLTGDDVAQLWVNPDSSTFGAASAPGGSLTSSGGTDIARIASFVLYNRAASEPSGLIDDVRLGTSWSDVTPAVPEPGTIAIGAIGLAGLLLRKRIKK